MFLSPEEQREQGEVSKLPVEMLKETLSLMFQRNWTFTTERSGWGSWVIINNCSAELFSSHNSLQIKHVEDLVGGIFYFKTVWSKDEKYVRYSIQYSFSSPIKKNNQEIIGKMRCNSQSVWKLKWKIFKMFMYLRYRRNTCTLKKIEIRGTNIK